MDWNNPDEVRAYHRNYYHQRRRQPMIDYLGGVCVRCGSTEELQFDHITRESKSFHIGSRMSLRQPDVKAELDKCQLLCKSCHLIKTSDEMLGFTHGTIYGFIKAKCFCDVCTVAKREWYDQRNAKRRMQGGRGPYKTHRGSVAE